MKCGDWWRMMNFPGYEKEKSAEKKKICWKGDGGMTKPHTWH
jgi:hypothetical protein